MNLECFPNEISNSILGDNFPTKFPTSNFPTSKYPAFPLFQLQVIDRFVKAFSFFNVNDNNRTGTIPAKNFQKSWRENMRQIKMLQNSG